MISQAADLSFYLECRYTRSRDLYSLSLSLLTADLFSYSLSLSLVHLMPPLISPFGLLGMEGNPKAWIRHGNNGSSCWMHHGNFQLLKSKRKFLVPLVPFFPFLISSLVPCLSTSLEFLITSSWSLSYSVVRTLER